MPLCERPALSVGEFVICARKFLHTTPRKRHSSGKKWTKTLSSSHAADKRTVCSRHTNSLGSTSDSAGILFTDNAIVTRKSLRDNDLTPIIEQRWFFLFLFTLVKYNDNIITSFLDSLYS